VVAVALLATSVLGACSDSGGGSGGSAPSGSSQSAASGPSKPASSAGTGATAPKDVKGAIKALSDFKCSATGSVWAAMGTVTNSGKSKSTYVVQVAVVKPKTFEVLGTKEQSVDVEASQKANVQLDKIYSGAGKGLLCVPSVVASAK
jgi:hypothetical protein